ncbi:MAG: deoxyribose-phosphate aldolase [Candidatus Woesearchaeota archaeon]|jgi:deoxyribose-phosphate aldolase
MLKHIDQLTPADIASICDHTFLQRSEAYRKETKPGESATRLRERAFHTFLEQTKILTYRPYAVCVRPEDVAEAVTYLQDTGIIIASVVGFPNGNKYSTVFKVAETLLAIENGTDEIDMVMNYDKFKEHDFEFVKQDINAVVDAAGDSPVKLIIETSELTEDQLIVACRIAVECNVPFIKTSTGFGSHGAKPEHLQIMKQHFKRGIKMSGGITKENVKELLFALSDNGIIDIDPLKIRIGESSLL